MNDAFENFSADLSESERIVALAAWQACQARYQPVLDKLVTAVEDGLPCVRRVLKESAKPEELADLRRLITDSEEALQDTCHL